MPTTATDENVIETTEADVPYTESVAPPQEDRASVLTKVRIIAAQAQGLAGAIEQAAMSPRMRTEFIDAWRRWYGSFLGWQLALERLPFHVEDVLPMLRQRESMIKTWRHGFAVEMGTGAGVGSTQTAAVAPAAVQPVASAEKKPGILSTVPWYILIPAGIGAGVGVYFGFRWIFKQWFSGAEDNIRGAAELVDAATPAVKPAQTTTPSA